MATRANLPDKVNLGCGRTFVSGDGWLNLDYTPVDPAVVQADLLAQLPVESGSVRLVYSSHFLEHLPRARVPQLLAECFRILRPGGTLRLVLPDLEEMCAEYLARRRAGEHAKADLVVVEIIDQCVRLNPGGELGRLYRKYRSAPAENTEMIGYLRFRNGETLGLAGHAAGQPPAASARPRRSFVARAAGRIMRVPGILLSSWRRAWLRFVLRGLPPAFREQNVSLASVGERHHWLWDFHQLKTALESSGFESVRRCSPAESGFAGFPFTPLDVDPDGMPRKGAESMYVEATRPVP